MTEPDHTVSDLPVLALPPHLTQRYISQAITMIDAAIEYYRDHAPLSTSERAALATRLDGVRARGFERTESERFVGGLDLGAPIGAPSGQVRAALTIATLKTSEGPDLDALVPSLRACAAAIAGECGLDAPQRA